MANNKKVNTTRLRSGRTYKTAGMVIVVLFTFYLVLFLKENDFTYVTFFANYDNAVDVWNEGFDFFKDIMNTLDSVNNIIGKYFNFVIDSVDAIITFFQDKIEDFKNTVYGGTLFNLLKEWANNWLKHFVI